MAAPLRRQLCVLETIGQLQLRNGQLLFALHKSYSSPEIPDEPYVSPTNMTRLKPSLLRKLRGMKPHPVTALNHRNRFYAGFTKTAFDRKLYARFGSATKVDPSTLWPGKDYITV